MPLIGISDVTGFYGILGYFVYISRSCSQYVIKYFIISKNVKNEKLDAEKLHVQGGMAMVVSHLK